MTDYVFVYGTLKEGFRNHKPIVEMCGEYIGSFTTHDLFRMGTYRYSTFPGIFINNTDASHLPMGKVAGEIYEVNKALLKEMDRIESNGMFYIREKRVITSFQHECWVYRVMDEIDPDDFVNYGMTLTTDGAIQWTGSSNSWH